MKIRDILTRCLSSIVGRRQTVVRSPGPLAIWSGVYNTFREVPGATSTLNDPIWVDIVRKETRAVAVQYEHNELSDVPGEQLLLPLLAGAIGKAGVPVRILDFGGGMGIDFIHTVQRSRSLDVVYSIVESPQICEAARDFWRDEGRLRLLTSIPAGERFDIVHMDSVLQYVEDYPDLLRRLCCLSSRYVLLVRLSAGSFETYATAQRNVRGLTLAYWFINEQEIVDRMKTNGFALVYADAGVTYYDQSNFSPDRRMGHTRNLLFRRVADAGV